MADWPGAVLFDFDGVIVNSEPLHFQAFQKILAHEKIDLTEEEYYRELIGFDDRGAFRHVYSTRNLPLEPKMLLGLMTRKGKAMMELIVGRRYHALPGVEEFIRGLWRNYPLGICSGALRAEIEAMLEGVSLRNCFPIIVAAEDVTRGKPDPEGYMLCMAQMANRAGRDLKPQDCLVVEDAPTVIASIKTVGFKTLAVATSYPMEKLSHADWKVKTLQPREIGALIPQLKLGI